MPRLPVWLPVHCHEAIDGANPLVRWVGLSGLEPLTSALSGGRSAGETRPFRLARYPRLSGGVADCAVALTSRLASRYIAGVLIVAARGCQPCQRRTDR